MRLKKKLQTAYLWHYDEYCLLFNKLVKNYLYSKKNCASFYLLIFNLHKRYRFDENGDFNRGIITSRMMDARDSKNKMNWSMVVII